VVSTDNERGVGQLIGTAKPTGIQTRSPLSLIKGAIQTNSYQHQLSSSHGQLKVDHSTRQFWQCAPKTTKA